LGYCSIYIFMQTFMIPGTIFMSLLAGALFGVIKGGILVVFTATAGASSCYFVSKLIGRPLVSWLWPEKLRYFQSEIAKRKERTNSYLLMIVAILVQAGRALSDLKSVRELYDFKTLVVLFLIGSVAVAPTILKRKRTYE
ncbi:putative membrane protein, partial [Dichanthelium oligosanthes]